jgi:hypothetical protein
VVIVVITVMHTQRRKLSSGRFSQSQLLTRREMRVGALNHQCSGITREGRQCTVSVRDAHEQFCHLHDPARSEERRRSARRAGKAKPTSREVRDLKEEIRNLIADVRSGRIDRNDAGVIIQACRALKDFIELERRIRAQEEMEERLQVLEHALEAAEAARGA